MCVCVWCDEVKRDKPSNDKQDNRTLKVITGSGALTLLSTMVNICTICPNINTAVHVAHREQLGVSYESHKRRPITAPHARR